MRVVDLRPALVRAWTRPWQDGRGPRGDGGLLGRWAGSAADRLMERRVAARRGTVPGLDVISVGNLSLGGTGKTPVTAALARDLAAAGRTGCVLTRGYGSALAGPVPVAADMAGAGDEARFLAGRLAPSGWSVVQARDRLAGLRWLRARRPGVDTVLVEDGHQTAGVGRNLDILILDAWQKGPQGLRAATGAVFPLGPWRETARGAARADIWLIEDDAPPAESESGRPVAGFRRNLSLVDRAGTPASPPEGPWVALSGIARPWAFEAGVAALAGGEPQLAVRCADHAAYAGGLRERIVAEIRGEGAPLTVTTEKDWIKLQESWPEDLPLLVARLELVWTGARTLPELVGERLGAAGSAGA